MKKAVKRMAAAGGLLAVLAALTVLPAGAREPAQEDDPIRRGEYLATISGCKGCHTPIDPTTTLPVAGMEFAGGYLFDLGPAGTVLSKNLTSDPETGVGSWTDEELKAAIVTGVSPDGLHQFPIMPYPYFSKMADEDLDALVAYLRTLPPVRNEVPRDPVLPAEALPAIPRVDGITAPDPSDTAARGRYLMTALLACSDCHTPLDPETGAPLTDLYLAGGQPYEGPWGIVYGANITPHETTGLGAWSDEDIERVLRSGIRPDGRQVLLMPWPDYTALTEEDMAAVIYYLRNEVPAVEREVPAPELNEGFERYVEVPESAQAAVPAQNMTLIIVVTVAALVVAAVLMIILSRRRAGPAA